MPSIKPSLPTAAAAGAFAALIWPYLWHRFGGPSADGSMELVLTTLLVIALPAHAFVVGFNRPAPQAGASRIDTNLLRRVGAWLGAAVVITVVRQIMGL